jgi:hypothetical protein
VADARPARRRHGGREVDALRVRDRAAEQVQRAAHLGHRRARGGLHGAHVGGQGGGGGRARGALGQRPDAVQQQRHGVLQFGGEPAPLGGQHRVDARRAGGVDLRELALESLRLPATVAQRVAGPDAADRDRGQADVLLLADEHVVALVGQVERHGPADQEQREGRAADGRPAARPGLRREQPDREHQRVDGRVRRPGMDGAAQQHDGDDEQRHDHRRARRQQERQRQQRREQQWRGRLGVAHLGERVPQHSRLGHAPCHQQRDGAAEQEPAPSAGG